MSILADLKTHDSGYSIGIGVHSALSAHLVEEAGFPLMWLSGLEMSAVRLLPDANLVTLTEVATTLREIRRVTGLPIIVDADNAYGADEVALRVADEYSASGASAICIEDNAYPKRGSFYNGVVRRLEDTDVFCRRIGIVRRRLPEHVDLIARTEALVAGRPLDEAIQRLQAYIDAGCNAIFVQTTHDTVEAFFRVIRHFRGQLPIVVTPTAMPDVTAQYLHELGADIIIYSNVLIRTMVASVSTALDLLRREQRLAAADFGMIEMSDLLSMIRCVEEEQS